jgi:pimeloyl-ACP methyl ester carboxylesterase
MTNRLFRTGCLAVALAMSPAAARGQDAATPSFAVRVDGQGPPMILIPGFVSSGAVWDDVVAHYKARYTCRVLTLPGFAGQPAIAAPVLSTVRDEIIDYIRAQHLNKPVLVGHSLGGFLALWIAATAPDIVGPVISIDGVPFMPALGNPEATADSVRPQAEQMKALYASLTSAQLGMQSRMAFGNMITDKGRIEGATAWAAASDPNAAAAMIAELMTTDIREQVAAIRTPVLLIPAVKTFASMPGGADRALAAYKDQVKKIPSVTVTPATHALHFVMYDDLPFLLNTMDAFLSPAAGSER